MTTVSMEAIAAARGAPVYSSEGDKIGKVEDIYEDYETRQPEWVGIGTGGLLGSKRVLVPVEGAELRGDGLFVPYSKDQVKGAPDIDADEIDQGTEQTLYEHYGLGYSERRSETGLPAGGPGTAGPKDTDVQREGAMTRHEEELRVGKRDVEAGRARIRKWVETEPVAEDVELRRETARVTREPVERSASGGEIGDEEIDVPLRAEEAVVEKETVAKERIGLEKDVDAKRETVGGEVRKERVDVEGDIER
jgi:uncharacterized protein (TIGR02271 family)